MALVMWTVGGVVSLLIALVYCELATLVPQSGGDFSYIYKGVGPLPAFLTVWIGPLWTQCAGTAVLALVFTDYFLAFVYGTCTPPESLRKLIAALNIAILGMSNVISIKVGVYVQVISSVVKTLALSVIVIGGVVFLCQGRVENFKDSFEDSATEVKSHALSLYSIMFAYTGYVNISNIAEEIKDSKKNIPRAIVICVLLVTLIYITTNVSYFVLIPKVEFLQSNAVAYDWALKGIPTVATFLPICVMCSVYGANNGGSFSVPRIMFAAGRRGLYPQLFSFLHVDRLLPAFGILVYHIVSILMLIPGDVGQMINFCNFLAFVINMFSCIALLRLKRLNYCDENDDPNRFKVHTAVPVLALIICIFLIAAPFISEPRVEFLYSAGLVIGGIILYIPFLHYRIKLPWMDNFTYYCQVLFKICPTEKID